MARTSCAIEKVLGVPASNWKNENRITGFCQAVAFMRCRWFSNQTLMSRVWLHFIGSIREVKSTMIAGADVGSALNSKKFRNAMNVVLGNSAWTDPRNYKWTALTSFTWVFLAVEIQEFKSTHVSVTTTIYWLKQLNVHCNQLAEIFDKI